jgi:hypothetical protein
MVTRAAMVLDRGLTALARLAHEEYSIPVLRHICLRDGWANVADGFLACRVQLPLGDATESDDDPRIERIDSVMIPAEALSVVRKYLRAAMARAWVCWDDGRFSLRTEKHEVPFAPPAGASYPDLARIMPTGEFRASILLNPELLAKLASVLDELTAGQEPRHVRLLIRGEDEAVEWQAFTPDNRLIQAVLMPMDPVGNAAFAAFDGEDEA